MRPERLYSIGVYGFTEAAFFDAIAQCEVDVFCDVRARRGLRGPDYAFANSRRLQDALSQRGIAYCHLKQLSPSKETREAQATADKNAKVAKRQRKVLGDVFRQCYERECLADLDAAALFRQLPESARRPVFCCVEKQPEACHRSHLIEELARQLSIQVEHIIP